MVQSTAATVDDFMLEVSPDRLPHIQRMRELFLANLTGWEERMAYGMPAYGPAGQPTIGVAFNNQKQHIAFYAGEQAIQAFKDDLARPSIDCGKGCIRYRNPKNIDFAVMEAILKHIRARGGSAC